MHFLTNPEKVAVAAALNIPQLLARGHLTPEDLMAYGDGVVNAVLHKVMAGYTYHADGAQPASDEIFVFGSNLAGHHGAGAARAAMDHYGAAYGEGIGMTGKSYAIPTKDKRIETLGLKVVEVHIAHFKQFAINNPDKKFFVTRVGCGLAGFTDDEIAPLFRGCPTNCNFAEQWKAHLEPSEIARALVEQEAKGLTTLDKDKWIAAATVELVRLTTEVGVQRAMLAEAEGQRLEGGV